MSTLLPYRSANTVEAGCDEAGRGCLAGPVVAAAVVLPHGWDHPLLDDSKKLSAKKREIVRDAIEAEVPCRGVGIATPAEIDRINILNASFLAMHRALDALTSRPEHLLIDGNRFAAYGNTAHCCVVGGDGKYRSIAAASILAKTTRDAIMADLHMAFPAYGWATNMGYPTRGHRAAIRDIGPCDHHRKTFALYQRPKLNNV